MTHLIKWGFELGICSKYISELKFQHLILIKIFNQKYFTFGGIKVQFNPRTAMNFYVIQGLTGKMSDN